MTIKPNTPVAAAMGFFAFWAGAILRRSPVTTFCAQSERQVDRQRCQGATFTGPPQPAAADPAAYRRRLFMAPFRSEKRSLNACFC
jgi:hypothetical protein